MLRRFTSSGVGCAYIYFSSLDVYPAGLVHYFSNGPQNPTCPTRQLALLSPIRRGGSHCDNID